jgi:anhydro-N-acetylmuramic acid kinase
MVLSELFADAANQVRAKTSLATHDIRAIGSHGQTLRHRPRAAHPFTLQIANPSLIAERTGVTTVGDFRPRDMAAGGEGAPLVPAFHRWLFHRPDSARVVANIGGIANITYLPKISSAPVIGFDTGPGNTLLDLWVEKHLGHHYDRDGEWAASGSIHSALLVNLLNDPYFAEAPPKSTGREYFNLNWLNRYLRACASLPAVDVQTSLVELTAGSITRAIQGLGEVDEVYICGGGAHNRHLMRRLQQQLSPLPVRDTTSIGLPPDWVEAAAFAWLAHQTLEGQPGNLPSVTGARHPVILGGIYKS